MTRRTEEDVLRLARDLNVRFVMLQLIDILGVPKNVAIPVSELEKALRGEHLFDGSSIEGFVRIEESDMVLKPDPDTFAVFPWTSQGAVTARLICDVKNPDGSPFAGCPRQALKRVVREAESMGFTMMCGSEAEFFLFERDEKGKPVLQASDQAGYFDLSPMDKGEEVRRDIVLAMQEMGFEVEASHHEVAPGQHEIDFKHAEALRTADNIVTFRFLVRVIALRHGMHATFMPKPVFGVNGSGMHTHQSLFSGGVNAFADPAGRYGLSRTCLYYIGGLLKHAKAITAICNPLVNSYKRLVPGYEAPCYIAWSERNRSPLVRVPGVRGRGTRVEVRSPDPSCNPYLAYAVMLKAGLDGIRKKIEPPEPMNRNIYEMDDAEREALGVESLPSDLNEAIREMKNDPLIKEALGDHIFNRFIEAKTIEWDVYRTQVHEWEHQQYLTVF